MGKKIPELVSGGIVRGGFLAFPRITSTEQILIPDSLSHEEESKIYRMKLKGGTHATIRRIPEDEFERITSIKEINVKVSTISEEELLALSDKIKRKIIDAYRRTDVPRNYRPS